jgi:hypothetical protein
LAEAALVAAAETALAKDTAQAGVAAAIQKSLTKPYLALLLIKSVRAARALQEHLLEIQTGTLATPLGLAMLYRHYH